MQNSSGQRGQEHTIEIYGDFACFSRPELKIERFSYPIPTPAAARGLFEAIYFKPEFRWQITQVELLAMPSYIALRRNEVKDKASDRAITSWMKGTAEPEPLLADLTGEEGKGRTQRQTMALKNPRYRITAHIVPRSAQPVAACDAQFVRRASQGKCAYQPYLGCREFVCFFDYIPDVAAARREKPAVDYSQDLGHMLYDVWDLNAINARRDEQEHPQKKFRKTNTASVSLFKARIDHGVMDVPAYDDPRVLKTGRSTV
ncbi:MAG: type I-C CRISPR-associated protein Cas5c [Tepidisphaeraceae bacterium]